MGKLNAKALGLSLGIVWSAGVFIMGVASMAFNWGTKFVEIFSSMYIGYNSTLTGSVIGAVWGFVDAGIGGVLVAWLYNKFAK
ncbi:MAG: bacteriophage holin [Candidatus Omnitrophica bacterium]|nr:bacteriophage holin [Candidatus Omnitrophota bacterium]